MSFVPKVSFANFICRFGSDAVMMDYAEEIVLPAFLDTDAIRTYGDNTEYFFYDQKLISLPDENRKKRHAIAGRFIKNTTLRRTQIFKEDKGILKDVHEIASAPSAFFVLLLDNHKLLYATETPNAPELSAFKASTYQFIRQKHQDFLRGEHKRLNRDERVTFSEVSIQHPKPTLEIMPLNSIDSIETFVRNLQQIQKLELQILIPNDEVDAEIVYRGLVERRKKLHANTTKVVYQRKAGLDKKEAIKEIHGATSTGNQHIKLIGQDAEGNVVRGNNESFKLSIPIFNFPETTQEKAIKLNSIFNHQISQGAINVKMTQQEE